MTSLRTVRGAVVAALAACALNAQADTQDLAAASKSLRAALAKTRGLPSVAFKSVESVDEAMLRNMPVPGREDVQVSGSSCGGMLHAAVGYDDDEVVMANGRMVARQQGGEWKLRRGCLADGKSLPFVLDPLVMLGVLADLPDAALKVTNVEPGKLRDKDVMTYGVTITGEQASELSLCGAMPRSSGGRMMVMIGGAGGPAPKAEVTLDVGISVDPATSMVVRVHCKAYSKSELPGNVQVRFAGAGGVEIGGEDDEEEEEEKPAAKDAPLQFSKGLPKRRLDKKTSLTDFDVTLSQHGEVKKPELSDAAKALLGLN